MLREHYNSQENLRNPANKLELLTQIPNVMYHRTIVNDEKMSVPKETHMFKNLPETLRLTTICVVTCSIRRKGKYVVDMFLSEMVLADRELFRRHFYHMGIVLEAPTLEIALTAMTEMVPVWPERKENSVNIYPRFRFPKEVPTGVRDTFLAPKDTEKYTIGDWNDYINGVPSLIAPRELPSDWKPSDGIFWADLC